MGIGVIERLGTESHVQIGVFEEGRAVINIGIWLDNPNQFFTWMIEIQFDFVGGRTDGFVTSELKLFNEVFVWILCHTSTFIGIKEDVINVEGRSNKGFLVRNGIFNRRTIGKTRVTILSALFGQVVDSEKDFIRRTELKVDTDFMVLKSNQRKSESWVTTEPELKWDVKSCFWKSITRSTDCGWDINSRTGRINISKVGVRKVSKLGSLSNHFVVTTLLFSSQSKLVPDVHPVTVLTVNALTTDFNFNH